MISSIDWFLVCDDLAGRADQLHPAIGIVCHLEDGPTPTWLSGTAPGATLILFRQE